MALNCKPLALETGIKKTFGHHNLPPSDTILQSLGGIMARAITVSLEGKRLVEKKVGVVGKCVLQH